MATAEEITSNLTVRAIPPKVRATLSARAKARHLSLNSYLVEILTKEAEAPTMEELLADIDRIRKPGGYGITSDDALAAIRSARDERDAKWD